MTSDAATLDRSGLAERERVLTLLPARKAELRALGVARLRLFGSMARGEAGPQSDVDLMAEIDHDAKFSLIDHVGLEHDLGELLGRQVDISTAPWKMRRRMQQLVDDHEMWDIITHDLAPLEATIDAG